LIIGSSLSLLSSESDLSPSDISLSAVDEAHDLAKELENSPKFSHNRGIFKLIKREDAYIRLPCTEQTLQFDGELLWSPGRLTRFAKAA